MEFGVLDIGARDQSAEVLLLGSRAFVISVVIVAGLEVRCSVWFHLTLLAI